MVKKDLNRTLKKEKNPVLYKKCRNVLLNLLKTKTSKKTETRQKNQQNKKFQKTEEDKEDFQYVQGFTYIVLKLAKIYEEEEVG